MNVHAMSKWLDLAVLAIVIAGAGIGAWSGVLRQVVRLLTYATAMYITAGLHGRVAAALGLPAGHAEVLDGRLGSLNRSLVPHGVCFSLTFLAVYLGLYVATLLFQKAVKALFVKPQDRHARNAVQALGLQTLDRIAGGVVGATMGALVAATIVLGLSLYPGDGVQSSMVALKLRPLLMKEAQAFSVTLPSDGRATLERLLQQVERASNELARAETNGRGLQDAAPQRANGGTSQMSP